MAIFGTKINQMIGKFLFFYSFIANKLALNLVFLEYNLRIAKICNLPDKMGGGGGDLKLTLECSRRFFHHSIIYRENNQDVQLFVFV